MATKKGFKGGTKDKPQYTLEQRILADRPPKTNVKAKAKAKA